MTIHDHYNQRRSALPADHLEFLLVSRGDDDSVFVSSGQSRGLPVHGYALELGLWSKPQLEVHFLGYSRLAQFHLPDD